MLTTEEFYPTLDRVGRVGVFNMLESFVENHITCWSWVLAQNLSGEETPSPHPRFLQLDPPPQCELNQHATTQSRGDTVVPK